jgi:glycosyltransferase involved in cell wall biosynthesis
MKSIRNWLYWKLIEHQVIQKAAAVFFTCAEEMRLARQTFRPYNPARQINVGYGVGPPPTYHPGMQAAFEQRCPGLKQRPYFLFFGRIHPKKGVDLLIEAYAALLGAREQKGKSEVPCLVIAGPGLETPFGLKMRELAGRNCPPGCVFWPGMLTGDAKWGALNGAEAFALPSHQENFGIAVVEAMACGVPVLISRQINIWKEIAEDQAGLVAEDTGEGTRRVLLTWAGLSEKEKSAMKEAAKTSYEKRFAISATADNLLSTIQDLIVR